MEYQSSVSCQGSDRENKTAFFAFVARHSLLNSGMLIADSNQLNNDDQMKNI